MLVWLLQAKRQVLSHSLKQNKLKKKWNRPNRRHRLRLKPWKAVPVVQRQQLRQRRRRLAKRQRIRQKHPLRQKSPQSQRKLHQSNLKLRRLEKAPLLLPKARLRKRPPQLLEQPEPLPQRLQLHLQQNRLVPPSRRKHRRRKKRTAQSKQLNRLRTSPWTPQSSGQPLHRWLQATEAGKPRLWVVEARLLQRLKINPRRRFRMFQKRIPVKR
jgi:hypothetical protein